ncbi:MLP-like protein 31 [Linum perenne]
MFYSHKNNSLRSMAVDFSAMSGKLEAEVELKAPPAKFYNVFRQTAHHVPNHAPSNIQDVQLHQGDWDCHHAIKIWHYTCDHDYIGIIGIHRGEGRGVQGKSREFDDAKKTAKLIGVDGDVMKIYKVYNVIYKVIPKGNGEHGVAKLAIEYES